MTAQLNAENREADTTQKLAQSSGLQKVETNTVMQGSAKAKGEVDAITDGEADRKDVAGTNQTNKQTQAPM